MNGLKIFVSYRHYAKDILFERVGSTALRVFLPERMVLLEEDYYILEDMGWKPPIDFRKFWFKLK